jgi:hypothetical protein
MSAHRYDEIADYVECFCDDSDWDAPEPLAEPEDATLEEWIDIFVERYEMAFEAA